MLRSNTAGRAIRREDLTMGTTKILKGRAITHGKVTGEAIVSKSAFGFYGAVDPGTGVVTDKRHELYGKNIAGKVLVFPEGRGSTAGAIAILELARCGTVPAAMVNRVSEPILATGAILAEKFYNRIIPVVDNLDSDPIDELSDGDTVTVDADKGEVTIDR
jgi:predicted aconitase with swiveling domain